jgi:hypothetical protein
MTVLDEKSVPIEAWTELPHVSDLDDLRPLSNDQLMAVFRNGLAPTSVKVVDGDPKCAPLSPVRFAGGRFERWFRRYAKSDRCIWHGKGFQSFSDQAGWGYNRLGLGPALQAFPFHTFIGPSKLDDAPSLVLDFDVPKNPVGERQTWDELREVAPGLFLGASGLRLFGRYLHLLWFAVDANHQDPVLGV